MAISVDQIKELRDRTGISVMQCRKALEETNGDMEKAILILKKKSAEIADKKGDRTLGAGAVAAYVHGKGSIGAIVELYSETDFVSNNPEFQTLAHDIAMQVAASNPEYVSANDIPEEVKAKMKEAFLPDVKGKPENMKEKILEGKLNSYFEERILLEQPFVKNPDQKIKDLVQNAVQKFGERVEIGRMSRFAIRK
jgi:elongation factor Ts